MTHTKAVKFIKETLETYGKNKQCIIDWETLDEVIQQAIEIEGFQIYTFADEYAAAVMGGCIIGAQQYYCNKK